ncbi:hypothetical protein PINS_up000549 [Pythium insidiosum]|nr:hypothetical protein PINS_up000549 [Pythium insidiosum]
MRSFALTLWLLLVLLAHSAYGIYEDQAGKLDWKVENVGRVVAVAFGGGDKRAHSPSARGTSRAAYVASDARSRAIARLDSKTGSVKWRRVLSPGDAVDTIQLTNYGLLSVSSNGSVLRLWDVADGALLWDTAPFKPASFGGLVPLGDDKVVMLTRGSAALVSLKDGAILWRTDLVSPFSSIDANALSSDGSTLYLLGASQLVALEVATGSSQKLQLETEGVATTLQRTESGKLVVVDVASDHVVLQPVGKESDNKVVRIADMELPISKSSTPRFVGIETAIKHALVLRLASGKRVYCRVSSSLAIEVIAVLAKEGLVSESLTDDTSLFHVTTSSPDRVQVTAYSSSDAQARLQWNAELDIGAYGGDVSAIHGGCPSRKNGVRCRVALVMKDDGLVMTANDDTTDGVEPDSLNSKNVLWAREEALANIKDVQWITPAESEIEKQPMKGIPSFMEELEIEADRLRQLVRHVATVSSSLFEAKGNAVDTKTRKEPDNAHFFGFSKLIVLLTESGRLYAIRAETNVIVWSVFVGPEYRLIVTRDHPAMGSGAELLLVTPDGSNMIWLDGDDGQQRETRSAEGAGDSWIVLLPKRKHHIDENETSPRRGVAIVDAKTLEVTIFPKELSGLAHPEAENFYFSRFDADSNAYLGYTIDNTGSGEYRARQVWSVIIPADQVVVATARQRDGAVIDSSVTITGDDSLLLKYLNPHMFGLATLATETVEGGQKSSSVLYMSLVDAVSGRIIHRVRHVHGSEPVRMVQSENWVVYSFWNSKEKRTELVSLSLFDGAIGTHGLNLWKRPSWNEFRSSYDPRAPFVLQRSFIYPARIQSLGVTVTSRGITPPYILVGMENGQIYKMPRGMINPRQPDKAPTQQEQEEGLIQYTPLVPMHNNLNFMITYNQTIANVKSISTTPVELESTTLVFAHGLDLFYVRLAPANAFDVLPLDFNYELLVLLCLTFFGANVLAKTLAQRKALNEAWK